MLKQKARDYTRLSPKEQVAFQDRLIQAVDEGAIPFLLMRVQAGTAHDAGHAIKRLKTMLEQDAQWRGIIERIPDPINSYQAQLLAYACEATGALTDILKALPHLEENMQAKLVNISVARLQESIARGDHTQAAESAASLAKVAPKDARLLYLQAIAEAARGQSETARALETLALGLNADSEAPHYRAGEMLREMKLPLLSQQEWLKILAIPPAGDVYDINAHLRLASIHAANHKHVDAADSYDAVVKLYDAALGEKGNGYGIIGTDVKGLAKMAADQRRYAAGNCEEAVAKTPAATKEGKIQIGLTTCSRTNSRLTGAQDWFGKKHPKERCGTIGGRHAKASIPVATARGAQRVPVALTKGRP